MKHRLMSVALITLLALVVGSWGFAQEAKKKVKTPEYVGAKKCKMCHKKVEHSSWLKTKHATAYDVLKAEDKKNDSCVVCHSTGFGVADTLLEGVQCEACHGPGSLYKSAKIMSKKKYKADREAQHKLAVKAGLLIPDEKMCTSCHNKTSPTFKGFDYAKMKAKGIHSLKSSAPAKKDST